MALRRALASLAPRLLQPTSELAAPFATQALRTQLSSLLPVPTDTSSQQPSSNFGQAFRTFASDAVTNVKTEGAVADIKELSLSPSNKITYNELNHRRFAPGTEGRPFAYFVLTGGRFLYASAVRLAVLKVVVSLSAAADTLALSSLEVDLSGVEEGQTITVKWRGKPVFITHRTDEAIKEAESVPMSDLKDPQKDSERVVDPKYLIVIGVCTHLGCVPIAGTGNYNGWFCPCHGSHYDNSGRIREGPAPYNLEVPEYRFMDGKKVIIG
mmetsp:Transcript_20669/g.45239  ORF Transcript_20669/g.45239 Transcript_20669/m.45239 type:complete len:269 (+) Transcript_20669:66-872(+)|eukprot:CAMPEP_0202906994 /NCGR_PEP_ID=MMETSP1392-20130828/40941_1 /ASSEMBLY_ACC=CAM_ASM_000868 /TAXON_ID=225041 /ORGANISM="Chlamydomonas chlamydogama, Strain SAG 11-48b" /LENGTH=268 /DNA_ID=CAMNT_0049595711 /DNA_START=52 /DNA_END=858 /DNA_ORIENTATION=+